MSGDQSSKKEGQDKVRADEKHQKEAKDRRSLYEALELGEQAGKKAGEDVLRGVPKTPKLPVEGLSGISPSDTHREAEREGRAPYEGLEVKSPSADTKLILVGEVRLESRVALREGGRLPDVTLPPDLILPGERDLPPEEKAERQRVAHPANGWGYRHGAARADLEQKDRWYRSLTDAKRRALDDPNARVFVLMNRSRSGSETFNLALSERSKQDAEQTLRARYGVRAQIEIHALGEERAILSNHPDGKDNHLDRVATIDIIEGGSPAGTQPPDLKAAEKAGADVGRGLGTLPEKPHRETPRDIAIELVGHALAEALGHALEVPLTPISVGGMYAHKLLEAHKENKEATEKGARLVGAYYAIDLIGDDAMRFDPHSVHGTPYTQAELASRLYGTRGSPFQDERGWLATLGTVSGADTARVDHAIARGVQDAVDAANGLMRRFGSAEERRAGLLSLRQSVIERIDHERRLRGNELAKH